jgi:hypothetical protein
MKLFNFMILTRREAENMVGNIERDLEHIDNRIKTIHAMQTPTR